MKIAGSTPIARYAERKERYPRVAVFDYFADRNETPQHGDRVEDIIRRTSGLSDRKVQNFQNAYERETSFQDVFDSSKSKFREKLRDYTIETLTGFYGATKQNLQTILTKENNKIRVINQSQSQCSARIARPFIGKVLGDEDFRVKLKEVYDLPLRSHKDTVAEALLNDVQEIMDGSRHIARARNEYLETAKMAHDQGIAHVVTAGNLGRLTNLYENLGIDAPEDAYKSVLANEYTTVIGATASQGTTSFRDDKAASFTSVYADAEFAMHGVNVEVPNGDDDPKYSNGTSFSAPQTTALIYEMFEAAPELSVPEMESLLHKSTVPVVGTDEQLGAGQIDPSRALFLAEQTHFVRQALEQQAKEAS